MEQAARDARSASLPILRPAGTAALLGTGLESGPGRREGTDILVSTHSTPCLMCPGRWGHARAAGCLLVGFVQWGCQPPGRPKNRFSSQQCCAVPAVLHCSVGSALRQAWQLSWQPCSCAVGWYLSKAELHALGPHSRELPRRPKGLPWLHQDVATVLPHLWHLSAAVCSLSPAHGPWPQISRGAGLTATPCGSRCHPRGATQPRSSCSPGFGSGDPSVGTAALGSLCQKPPRVPSWLCGRGWWPPASGSTMPGSGTSTAPVGQKGWRSQGHLHSQIPESRWEQS